MFGAMRWITPRHALVQSLAVFEAGAGAATPARSAATPVRTGTARRLETQSAVVGLIVITVAAWTVALVVIFADRPRPLLAAPLCP